MSLMQNPSSSPEAENSKSSLSKHMKTLCRNQQWQSKASTEKISFKWFNWFRWASHTKQNTKLNWASGLFNLYVKLHFFEQF